MEFLRVINHAIQVPADWASQLNSATFISAQGEIREVHFAVAIQIGGERNPSYLQPGQTQLLILWGKIECNEQTLVIGLSFKDEAILLGFYRSWVYGTITSP